jgi:hypothetical protein
MNIHNVFIYIFFKNFWCFNATFSNISTISWRPVLVVEEAGVLGESTTDHVQATGKHYHQHTERKKKHKISILWSFSFDPAAFQ